MKHRIVPFMLALLLFLSSCAHATSTKILDGKFTDTTNTTTEDAVVRFDAFWHEEENPAYNLNVLLPDQLAVDTNLNIFKYVVEGENPPARYFPEETQKQIADIVGEGAVDALYLTEFMRLHAESGEAKSDVGTSIVVDVDYRPGETVLVVLADTSDPDNLVWTALPAVVSTMCQIDFVIPQELMQQFMGKDILYTLLTLSPGKALYRTEEQIVPTPHIIPSIEIDDTYEVISVTTIDGFEGEREFEVAIVKETQPQLQELETMRQYVMEDGGSVVSWFPENIQNEIDLLVDDSINIHELVIYDYLPVYTIDYEDTYGDVLITFSFVTPYQEGDTIVTVLGLPLEEPAPDGTQMDWNVQIARVDDHGVVEIAFGQLQLLEMLEEPGLLMLLVERKIL